MRQAHLGYGLSKLPSRKLAATRSVYATAGLASTPPALDRLVRRNLTYTAGYYQRAARLVDQRYRRTLQRTIAVRGVDRLEAATSGSRGAILVAAHLGDFDLAGSWIAEVFGRSPVVPVAAVSSAARQDFYDRVRRACGFTLRRQGDTTVNDLATDIRRGRLVIIMLDRQPTGRTIDLDLFGRPATVSAAPHALSAMTGAPVLSAATWNVDRRRRVLSFGDPHAIAPSADPAGGPSPLHHAVRDLERAVLSAPHQWHVPADRSQLPWRPDLPSSGRWESCPWHVRSNLR